MRWGGGRAQANQAWVLIRAAPTIGWLATYSAHETIGVIVMETTKEKRTRTVQRHA